MSTDPTTLSANGSPAQMPNTNTEPKKTGDRFTYLSLNLTRAIVQHAGNGTDLKSIAATVATVVFPILGLIAFFETILFFAVNPFIWIANRISGPVAILPTDEEERTTADGESSSELVRSASNVLPPPGRQEREGEDAPPPVPVIGALVESPVVLVLNAAPEAPKGPPPLERQEREGEDSPPPVLVIGALVESPVVVPATALQPDNAQESSSQTLSNPGMSDSTTSPALPNSVANNTPEVVASAAPSTAPQGQLGFGYIGQHSAAMLWNIVAPASQDEGEISGEEMMEDVEESMPKPNQIHQSIFRRMSLLDSANFLRQHYSSIVINS